MRALSEFIFKNRNRAIAIAMVCAVLPFIQWFSTAIMALITLRKSTKEGFLILLWISLPGVVLGFSGHPEVLLNQVICQNLLTFILAVVLRHTLSWSVVIDAALLIGIVIVSLVHTFIADPQAWWLIKLSHNLESLNNVTPLLAAAESKDVLAKFAMLATGSQILIVFIGSLSTLAFARWWQSYLFYKGGFNKEIKSIEVSKISFVFLLITSLGIWSKHAVCMDIAPLLLLPLMIAGLSLIHHVINQKTKRGWFWLILFYSTFILFVPYVVGFVCLTALTDCWFHFRQRGKNRGSYITNKSS